MIIDHIGIVVESIEEASVYYARHFGYAAEGAPVTDPLQEAEVLLMRDEKGQAIELIRPTSPTSPISRAMKKGGGLNHVCYRVKDLAAASAHLEQLGAVSVRSARPAVLFGGRRVAFYFTRANEIVELVEEQSPGTGGGK
ncbi:MAG TPA: VOC family protein [Elusimicrobiota bacterium]|nr:VOC family protein [Elusimicrobiota bacterium]